MRFGGPSTFTFRRAGQDGDTAYSVRYATRAPVVINPTVLEGTHQSFTYAIHIASDALARRASGPSTRPSEYCYVGSSHVAAGESFAKGLETRMTQHHEAAVKNSFKYDDRKLAQCLLGLKDGAVIDMQLLDVAIPRVVQGKTDVGIFRIVEDKRIRQYDSKDSGLNCRYEFACNEAGRPVDEERYMKLFGLLSGNYRIVKPPTSILSYLRGQPQEPRVFDAEDEFEPIPLAAVDAAPAPALVAPNVADAPAPLLAAAPIPILVAPAGVTPGVAVPLPAAVPATILVAPRTSRGCLLKDKLFARILHLSKGGEEPVLRKSIRYGTPEADAFRAEFANNHGGADKRLRDCRYIEYFDPDATKTGTPQARYVRVTQKGLERRVTGQ